MRKRNEVALGAKDKAAAVTRGEVAVERPKVYVIECDAFELPEIYDRRNELVPKEHLNIVNSYFGSNRDNASWYGEDCKSWDDARKLLREGWPKGVKRAKGLVDKLSGMLPEPESARRRPRWNDDDSGELDRDKLYSSGIDTAFRGTSRVKQRAPRVLRIVANWAMNAGCTADQVAWNGAAITALVDCLEAADYSVELSLALPTRHWYDDGHITMPVVRVKTAGDPLSLNTIAAIAGHAGIYRSFGFAAICTSPRRVDSSLGSCLQVQEAWEQAVQALVVEPVDAYMELSFDEAGAIRSAKKVLRKLFPDMDFPKGPDSLKLAGFKKSFGANWETKKADVIRAHGVKYWNDVYNDDELEAAV